MISHCFNILEICHMISVVSGMFRLRITHLKCFQTFIEPRLIEEAYIEMPRVERFEVIKEVPKPTASC